jgi:hypothetical protein
MSMAACSEGGATIGMNPTKRFFLGKQPNASADPFRPAFCESQIQSDVHLNR